MSKSAVQKSLSMPDNLDATLNKFRHLPQKSKSGLVFNLAKKNITTTSNWNRGEFRVYHSTSGTTDFSNTATWEIEESYMLLNAYFAIQLSQLSQTGGTAGGLYYNKLPLIIDQLTIFSGNGTHMLKVFHGEDLYWAITLSHASEALDTINTFAGMGTAVERSDDNANDRLTYYLPLRSIFFNTDLPLMFLKGKLRIVVKFRSANDSFVYDGTSPTGAGITSCLLWCFFQDFNKSIKASILANRNIKHYRVLLPERAQMHIPAGTTDWLDKYINFTSCSAFFLFYITKPSPAGDDIVDNNVPIKSFVLRDSSGNIISYASEISGTFNRSVMSFEYFDQFLRNSPFLENPNTYFFSWGSRPPIALLSGANFGFRKLNGNERISVSFDSPTPEDYTIHIVNYAYELLQVVPSSGQMTILS